MRRLACVCAVYNVLVIGSDENYNDKTVEPGYSISYNSACASSEVPFRSVFTSLQSDQSLCMARHR